MKRLILAALAVVTLGMGTAFAQSFSHESPPAGQHRTASGN
jgi:hypothetical protein